MMGIYIKGMEMLDIGSYLVVIDNNTPGKTFITFKHAYDSRQIVGSYEAIPVPPHGDLIERKAISLMDFEIVMCDGDYKEGMKMLLEKTESAPTIIPASEEA